ncbi:hypothetical protein [Natrinema salaciae]|uniref:DUF7975 domain-containing protein n=1 Tax=Natrinema salaciae TaxID=1186196 RepID=A0A1H9T7U0_9EURY|nr:hypothetical protein [Natrinema salaciae]SER93340.1 hypothetical protein SAMN04489841_0086 [Natrinema salaciae]
MTRFDAAEPADRRKLYVDAITAHRERGSGFLTVEADDAVLETETDDAEVVDGAGEAAASPSPAPEADDRSAAESPADLGVPWVQFGDGTINLDCTDAELDAVKSVLGAFPAFKIDELHRPDDAAGVNVRISAKADANRIAQFVDELFLEVYDLPSSVRVWVVEV